MRVWCHSCPVCIYSLVLRVEDTLYGGEGTGEVEFGQQHVTNLGTVLVGSSSCILFKDCILEPFVELCGVVEPVEFPCIVTELFLGLVHTLCVNPDGVLEMVMIKTGIIVRKRRFFIGSALRFFFHPNTSPSSLSLIQERFEP